MLLGVLAAGLASSAARAQSAPNAPQDGAHRPAVQAPRLEALDCFRRDLGGTKCPRLALLEPCKGKRCLEPSGLAYDTEHRIWVGVSDNYDDLIEEGAAIAGNVLFWFQETVDADGVIGVRPLLSADQAAAFPLYDLEGVTRAVDGVYFASGSWSLGESPYRLRMLRFRVVPDGRGGFAATDLGWVAPDGDANLRRWLIERSGLAWKREEVDGKPEKGGINLEGLSIAPGALNGRRSLLLGFRGPERALEGGSRIQLLRVALDADDALACEARSSATVVGGPSALGIRALEALEEVPGAYLFVLAPGGADYNPSYAGVGLPGQERIELPDLLQLTHGVGVAPEGIAAESVRSLGDGRFEVVFGAVDDVSCRFLKGRLEFRAADPRALVPFRPDACPQRPVAAPR
jgi:hypothetical protein